VCCCAVEEMAASTAKSLPLTVVELQARMQLVRHKYSPTQAATAAGTHVLPAWPVLERMPQRA
jgi:hypothetical protein